MLRLLHSRLIRASKPPDAASSKATSLRHFLEHHLRNATSQTAVVRGADPSLALRFLRDSCGLSPAAASAAARRIDLKCTKKPQAVLAVLQGLGVTKPYLARLIARRPELLVADPERTIQPKLDFYRRIGLQNQVLARLLTACPKLLVFSLQKRLLPNYSLLKSILQSDDNVAVAVHRSPDIIIADLRKVVLPKLESLRSYAVTDAVLVTLLITHSKSLIRRGSRFQETFDAIQELGIHPSSSMFAHAFGVLSIWPKSTWASKLDNYMGLGWSQEQVIRAFIRHPYCISASNEKVRKNLKFFAEKLGWEPEYLARNPVVISLSLEKRIIPRYLVLEMLRSKGILNGGIRIHRFVMTDKMFMEKYVISYQGKLPELLEIMKASKVAI